MLITQKMSKEWGSHAKEEKSPTNKKKEDFGATLKIKYIALIPSV